MIKRALLGLIPGCLLGAIGGALLLGIPTYLDQESGFWRPNSAWTPVAVGMGIFFGGISGCLIGLCAGMLNARKAVGAVIGVVVGTVILLVLFILGLNPLLDPEIFAWGVLSIPIGAIIRVLVSAIVNLAMPKETPGR